MSPCVAAGEARHFLFLQGPPGPFFNQLGKALHDAGCDVTRICFTLGDRVDDSYNFGMDYRDSLDNWADFVETLAHNRAVSDLVIYGDCRPYHAKAIARLKPLGVGIHVFEEGYIRPGYITYEYDGVNNNSLMPREAGYYIDNSEIFEQQAKADYATVSLTPPQQQDATHAKGFTPSTAMGLYAFRYYLLVCLGRLFYPRFQSHRPVACWREGIAWLGRLATYRRRNRIALRKQRDLYKKRTKYYIALLQLCGDSQITNHSPYTGMRDYLEEVIANFARSAPVHTMLVIKNHPYANGLGRIQRHVDKLSRYHNVYKRVLFIDIGRLKGLLKRSSGVITINSTAAISGLHHNKPVIALGRAIYDIKGLTYQGSLNRFWHEAGAPDRILYQAFRNALIARTQVAGNFFTAEGRTCVLSHFCATQISAQHILRPDSGDSGAEETAMPVQQNMQQDVA